MNWAHTINRTTHTCTLVVINNFNIDRARVASDEAHAELIVDADAVLTGSVTFKRFEPVTRRGAQKIQCLSSVELGQLTLRY